MTFDAIYDVNCKWPKKTAIVVTRLRLYPLCIFALAVICFDNLD